MSDEQIVNSEYSRQLMHDLIDQLYDQHKYLRIKILTGKQRTNKQNAAMHLYLTMLSDELNNRGIDRVVYAKHMQAGNVQIPWDHEGRQAKEVIWREIQEAITGQYSTTQPTVEQYGQIYEAINRMTAMSFGINIPWPCKEERDSKTK